MESKLGDNIDNNVIAQNLGTNQIFLPKNSANTGNTAPQPVAGSNGDVAVPPAGAGLSAEPPAINVSYFNLFGYEISKTTLYIAIAFLVLVGVYYYYVKSKSKPEEPKSESQKKSKKLKKSKKSRESKDEDKESSSEESE